MDKKEIVRIVKEAWRIIELGFYKLHTLSNNITLEDIMGAILLLIGFSLVLVDMRC